MKRNQYLNKNKVYFEGWYFRLTHPHNKSSITFIPGISLCADKNKNHAFIQVLNHNGVSDYIKYPLSDFDYQKNPLTIKIGPNIFTLNYMHLQLGGKSKISGYIRFTNILRPQFSMQKLGLMGPLKLVPNLPCYHDVISLRHDLSGSLTINNELFNWNKGFGYIETDRGYSFPKAYTWLQCNTFKSKGISFNSSVSLIKFGFKTVKGCYALLYTPTKEYNFTSWKGARVLHENYADHKLSIKIKQYQYTIDIIAKLPQDYEISNQKIIAPVQGEMQDFISETMTAELEIVLWHKGHPVLATTGEWCAAELINSAKLLKY